MKMFKLDDVYYVACRSESTRYGFRHLAILLKNGYEIAKAKCCYYNRTWEKFEFESVLHRVIDKFFSDEQVKIYKDKLNQEFGY